MADCCPRLRGSQPREPGYQIESFSRRPVTFDTLRSGPENRSMSLASRLGTFAADLRFERVPEAIRAKLRHHLLDSLGVICAGIGTPESAAIRTFLRARAGRGEAT